MNEEKRNDSNNTIVSGKALIPFLYLLLCI